MTGPLGKISLAATTFYVADLDTAIDWYADVLGVQPTMTGTDGHRFAMYSFGAAVVVLEPTEAAIDPVERGAENATVNLVVDRTADDVRGDLLARNVRCSEVVPSPHYRSFLFRDLDGNRYYVAQPITQDG